MNSRKTCAYKDITVTPPLPMCRTLRLWGPRGHTAISKASQVSRMHTWRSHRNLECIEPCAYQLITVTPSFDMHQPFCVWAHLTVTPPLPMCRTLRVWTLHVHTAVSKSITHCSVHTRRSHRNMECIKPCAYELITVTPTSNVHQTLRVYGHHGHTAPSNVSNIAFISSTRSHRNLQCITHCTHAYITITPQFRMHRTLRIWPHHGHTGFWYASNILRIRT